MLTNPFSEFFRKKIDTLDPLCCNFSFVNGGREEIIYNLENEYPQEYKDIFRQVFEQHFPDIDRGRVDAISFQQADGKLYSEDKLMVSINGAEKDCFLYPEIGCFSPWQHYCINSGVTTKQRSVKFYDMDTQAYTCMDFPKEFILFDKYGAGVGIKPDIVGIYLLCYDYDKVLEFTGLPDPVPADIKQEVLSRSLIHNFGLTFNIKTKEMVKLSYFFYNEARRSDIVPYLDN